MCLCVCVSVCLCVFVSVRVSLSLSPSVFVCLCVVCHVLLFCPSRTSEEAEKIGPGVEVRVFPPLTASLLPGCADACA